MASRFVETKTAAGVVGNTTVEWEISDWGVSGPLGDLVRTEASCLVNVGDINLLFHLQSYKSLSDPSLKFCSTTRKYCGISERKCDQCIECTSGPLAWTPKHHLPGTNVKCSGYSLLVDVLSPQEKLTFSVAAEVPEASAYARRCDLVNLKPGDPKKNVVAIEHFYRTAVWTVDSKGKINNYSVCNDHKGDITFLLTITLYNVTSAGTDGSWTEENPYMKSLPNNITIMGMESNDVFDINLTTRDGQTIPATKFILALRSSYFKRSFQGNESHSAFIKVDAKPLQGILTWMYTDKLSPECIPFLKEICEAAVWLELDGFWKTLECSLVSFCSPDNMYLLYELAMQYELSRPKEKIMDFIKRNL